MKKNGIIRGLKRKLRNARTYCSIVPDLNIEDLKKSHSQHEKLHIDPWYRLEKREPPRNFQVIMLSHLFQTCLQWNESLKKINEPYYLKVWLDLKPMITSEVVAGIKDRIAWYDHIDSMSADINLRHPLTLFPEIKAINDFSWKPVRRFIVYTYDAFVGNEKDYSEKEDFIKNKEYFNKLLKSDQLIISEEKNGEVFYTFHEHYSWVGEPK